MRERRHEASPHNYLYFHPRMICGWDYLARSLPSIDQRLIVWIILVII